jgi:hypothetical protein
MTTPEPTITPECDHNWPGIASLAIFGVTVFALALISCGGLPIRGQWQAICWLILVGITLPLAVALTVSAWRQDHWRKLAHQRAAIIRSRNAEIEDLHRTIRSNVGDDTVRAAGHVHLDPAERTAFRHIQAREEMKP